ncbi:MAG: hypothetical protein K0S49_35 [Microbacterium sp.]|nr:hypothetical protein [Microbacterium sp.]
MTTLLPNPRPSGRQWCPACVDDGSEGWVEIDGHRHELPAPRPNVYLYEPAHDGQAAKWAGLLPIWLDEIPEGADSYWLGWREFPTQAEAMEYARKIALAEHELRSRTAEATR